MDTQPWELSRIRLRSVGPKGARYRDVTLDLSELGKLLPVNGHDGQGLLFGTAPRRPSPASVLLLENGGGKSVLLKLVFSVLLPGRRQVIGGNGRVLENFVLDRDTAHVVLEWVHAKTGERLLTGKVMEWRGHTASQDPSRLVEEWYSLRPDDDLSTASLPFAVDGRLQPLSEYRRLVAEADRARPARQLTWERSSQAAWTEHLDALGLDYVRFKFQRAMNVDEGEAAGAFTFKSNPDFIDWLLTSVLDDEDPRSFADNFDKYALNVGDRDQMLVERRFVDGAVKLMKPVAKAATDRAAGQQMLAGAQDDYLRLAASVAARLAAERELHAVRQATAGDLATAYGVKEQARDDATKVVNEIRRQTDQLRLDSAHAEDAALAKSESELRLRGAAWDTTELLVTLGQRDAEVEAMTLRAREAEQRAAPRLDQRNRAATAFVQGLLASAAAADKRAKDRARDAAEVGRQTSELGRSIENLTGAQREANLLRQQAQEQLNTITRELDQAAAAGMMRRDEDPAGAAEAATLAAAELAERLQFAGEELVGIRRQVREAAEEARTADGTAQKTAFELVGAEAENTRLAGRAGELAAHVRVGDLLALDVENQRDAAAVDRYFDVLVDGLDRSVREVDGRARELRRAREDHTRVLAALGNGGLLPARVDVLRARDALESAGVPSVTGWQYLSSGIAARDRAAALAAHPSLADGVVVTDPTLLDRAAQVLIAARLLPQSSVFIGSSAVLLDVAANDHENMFVVPPNPAMYDEAAAETERVASTKQLDRVLTELAEQEARKELDQQLLSDLRSWRRDCPVGRLGELDNKIAELRDRHQQVVETAAALAEAADAAEQQLRAREQDFPELQARSIEAAASADRLAKLADLVAKRPALMGEVERHKQAGKAAFDQQAQLRDTRQRLSDERDDLLRKTESEAGQARRLREESGDIVGASPDPAHTAALDAAVVDVPSLRSRYKAAARAYDEVALGSELLDKLAVATELQANARAAVQTRPEAEQALAADLLRTAEGADAVSRGAAKAADERTLATVADQRNGLRGRIAVLEHAVAANKPVGQLVWIVLPDDRKPTSVEHGEQLVAVAEEEQRQIAIELEELRARRDQAARAAERARQQVEAFDRVASRIGDDPELPVGPHDEIAEPPGPFDGSADDALSHRETVRKEIHAARDLHNEAVKLLKETADELRGFSNDDVFDRVGTLRRILQAATEDTLAAHAEEWQQQLTARLRSLDTDLEEIDRNRQLLIERLTTLTTNALRTLRAAQRLSKLPAQLEGWSEQEFLRIRFADPDPAAMRAALGTVLDDTAAAVSHETKSASQHRDGMALLLRAVHAAVPRSFDVLVLKPDAVLRAERVPVAQMGAVFSGGQRLTAAIVLYCTMAALRADQRGMKMRHAGVLFLDNPIGRASAHYLLELQLNVAEALGVQLVYTTGLMEANALRVFPLIVRLRNDADLRAGLKYLQVEDRIAEHLPDGYGDDDAGTGTLSASRLFRRPVTPPPPPAADDAAEQEIVDAQ